MDAQAFLHGMNQAACAVSIITTDGKLDRAGVALGAMTSVSAELLSLVLRPSANDIGAGRAILRQPDAQGENPGTDAFAQHCQQYFSTWAQ